MLCCKDVDTPVDDINNGIGNGRIWTHSGNQGDVWLLGEVDIQSDKEWR